MGAYYSVYIDNFPLVIEKGNVPYDILSIFQHNDKRVLNSSDVKKSHPHFYSEELEEGFGEEAPYYFYIASKDSVAMRLDIAGINYERMRSDFEEGLNKYRDALSESHKHSKEIKRDIKQRFGDKRAKPTKRLDIKSYDFDAWITYVKRTLKGRIESHKSGKTKSLLIPSYCFSYFSETMGFPYDTYDSRYLIRVALDIFDCKEITLNYTDLVLSEYMDSEDDLLDEAKEYDRLSIPIFGKAIVLTEGSSDYYFLSNCFNILFPEISESIHFVDFGEVNAAGGASQIVAFIKILAAAGIKNRVIAVFDADTAAKDALKALKGITLPSNITVTLLPESPRFFHWPTIGPQGENIEVNINGKAVSLEMFFPNHLLEDKEGNKYPVQWKGYNTSLKQYQGEITYKDDIQRKFREMIESHKSGSAHLNTTDLENIRYLLEFLIENLRSNYVNVNL